MKYLITGGAGFLGSNLAKEVLERGDELAIFDNLSRLGAQENLDWLKGFGQFLFTQGNVANAAEIESVIKTQKPDVVFHLAGQVAMTTSISDPRKDFETNALGTFNVLNAVRQHCLDCAVLYSSTNKVYGDLEYLKYNERPTRYELADFPAGLSENISLEFASPYGCSKGAADQYCLDFHKTFGLKTAVFRHSSMYGGRQFSSYDQGWLGWFCEQAVLTKQAKLEKPFTISGNGKQVRDVLHAEDMVNLYFLAAKEINSIAGQVFNIGGGMQNSLSLLELLNFLEKELDVKLNYEQLPPRASDQKVFVADIAKIHKLIGWQPKVSKEAGIKKMLEWVKSKNQIL
jgi:CDP-paratose 2-epimerase